MTGVIHSPISVSKPGGAFSTIAMLDLNSKRWESLSAAGGNPRLVPQLITTLREQPTAEDWAEVMEQIGHQGTCYSSAYTAVPHLLELARIQNKLDEPWFFARLGNIAEPAERTDPAPEDLRSEFEAAMAEAAACALDAVVRQA